MDENKKIPITKIKPTDLNNVYAEMSDIVGIEETIKIYNYYRGQQVAFSQRFYSKEYVKNYVKKHYNGKNVRKLARMFGYSERRVRQMMKEKE